MFIVQRTAHFIWIILLILLLLFSPSSWNWIFHPSDGSSPGPTSATTSVEDNGFTLALQGITISGNADAAPNGTKVHAELVASQLPGSVSSFAEPVGTGVEITLEDDLQPQSPLTIVFEPNEVADWYAAMVGDDDLMPIVFASNDRELGVEFADAELMPNGSVVVTTDHLSGFYPGVTSADSFSDWLVNEIEVTLGTQSDQPACFNIQSDDSDWAIAGILDQVFWPCVTETTDGVHLELTNNSPVVWIISSDQSKPGTPVSSSFTSIVISAVARQVFDPSETAVLIPPDGSVTFTAYSPGDEIVFDANLNYPLTTVNATVLATIALLPQSKAKIVLDRISHAECMVNISLEVSGGVRVDGSFVRTIIDCISPFIKGLTGSLISSVTSVPGATIAMADATYRTLAGTDKFSFTLSRVTSDTQPWPTGRDDGPGLLYTWLGANMYGYPDWIACDAARDWCLVGYDGDEHLLVQMDGLNAMYWIDENVASPRDALLSTGLSETVVSEILGD